MKWICLGLNMLSRDRVIIRCVRIGGCGVGTVGWVHEQSKLHSSRRLDIGEFHYWIRDTMSLVDTWASMVSYGKGLVVSLGREERVTSILKCVGWIGDGVGIQDVMVVVDIGEDVDIWVLKGKIVSKSTTCYEVTTCSWRGLGKDKVFDEMNGQEKYMGWLLDQVCDEYKDAIRDSKDNNFFFCLW